MSDVIPVDQATAEALFDEFRRKEVARIERGKRPPAKLDSLKKLIGLYDKAVKDHNELGAEIKELERRIQAEMGDAEAGQVGGVNVFTYAYKKSWKTQALMAEHGHLTQNYMVPQAKLVFHAAKFAKDHPTIARQYQTREFRRVSGRRNAVG